MLTKSIFIQHMVWKEELEVPFHYVNNEALLLPLWMKGLQVQVSWQYSASSLFKPLNWAYSCSPSVKSSLVFSTFVPSASPRSESRSRPNPFVCCHDRLECTFSPSTTSDTLDIGFFHGWLTVYRKVFVYWSCEIVCFFWCDQSETDYPIVMWMNHHFGCFTSFRWINCLGVD